MRRISQDTLRYKTPVEKTCVGTKKNAIFFKIFKLVNASCACILRRHMKIADNTVVTIDYELTDDKGEIIDQSPSDEPLEYLHGHGQLVPGLERQLLGKQSGDAFKADVAATEGYGEYDHLRIIQIKRDELPEDLSPEIGMELSSEGPDGEPVAFWISNIQKDVITLDGNHPLAGQTLHFSIKIKEVRTATEEEIAHGHAHGDNDLH